jgi:hypothetical protein
VVLIRILEGLFLPNKYDISKKNWKCEREREREREFLTKEENESREFENGGWVGRVGSLYSILAPTPVGLICYFTLFIRKRSNTVRLTTNFD